MCLLVLEVINIIYIDHNVMYNYVSTPGILQLQEYHA